METLPMFEEDWVQTLVDAANGEGQFNEESEPIETVTFEGPIQASPGGVCDDTLLESPEIPATQPDTTPEKGHGEKGGDLQEGSKEDPGMVEGCEKGVESKRGGIAPSCDHQPGKDDADHFPLVTREQQQAFKQAKGQVSKMDGLTQAPKKPKAKAKTCALKRPAASKKDHKATKKPKDSAPDMAQPVQLSSVEDDEGGSDCTPTNLEGAFEEVADSSCEGEATSTHADPPTPRKKPAGRPKANAKTKSPKGKGKSKVKKNPG